MHKNRKRISREEERLHQEKEHRSNEAESDQNTLCTGIKLSKENTFIHMHKVIKAQNNFKKIQNIKQN